MYAISSPGANAAPRRWSTYRSPAWSSGELTPVERSVTAGDDRPRVRVGGRFAGEVSGVEFRDGRVEVVEVEYDDTAIRSSASTSTSLRASF